MTARAPLALAVDSDPATLETFGRGLRAEGLRVVTATTGDDALRAAVQQHPNLVLLSTRLSDMSGLEMMRRLRARTPIPVILVSADARTTAATAKSGVLPKRFSARQLADAVEEALGAAAEPPPAAATHVSVEGLDIDLVRRTVRRGGDIAWLTRTEWALLTYLAGHPGQTLTGSEILSNVWGPEYRDDLQYLRVWVSRLRSKLGAHEARMIIRTVRGLGYVFDPTGTREPTPCQSPVHAVRGAPSLSDSGAVTVR